MNRLSLLLLCTLFSFVFFQGNHLYAEGIYDIIEDDDDDDDFDEWTIDSNVKKNDSRQYFFIS